MPKPDYAHQKTDQQLAELERSIAGIYSEAAKDMQGKVDAYFESFAQRDAAEKAKLEDGAITEQQYTQWRLAQIGRGQRFEAMRDQLAERMTHANEIARAYINGELPNIYALNQRYTIESVQRQAGDVLNGIDFTLLNEDTVKRLLVEQPDLMPYYPKEKAIERGIDLDYGKKKITEVVTSGILQGQSINRMAKNLMDNISKMEKASAIRAARTSVTQAENAGRQAAAEQLSAQGVILKKVWLAMDDNRSRVVNGRKIHVEANGQEKDIDEPFIVEKEELMFPGDDTLGASGWNVYNCRCTRYEKVIGFKSMLTDEQRERANIRVKA